jgi:heat shock protein HtpX
MWFSGGRYRSRSRGSGGGQAQAILMLAALLFAILGPLAAQLLYFALSRRREYLADACGASYTRYPEGLASALEKIASDPGLAEQKNRVLAPMYIVNPLQGSLSAASLTSTHPATEDRIRILRSMGGASLADYEAAYEKAKGGGMVPASALKTARPVGVRAPGKDEAPPELSPQDRARETSDALWKLNDYSFIACPCGARLKIPPGFKSPQVRCPRCDRVHDIPRG